MNSADTRWKLMLPVAAMLSGCGGNPDGADAGTTGAGSNSGESGAASASGSSGVGMSGGGGQTTGGTAQDTTVTETGSTSDSEPTTGGTAESTGSDSETGSGSVCGADIVCTGDTAWSRKFGDLGGGGYQSILGLAVDAVGNSHIVGHSSTQMDFEPQGVLGDTGYIAKVDASGAVEWVRETYPPTQYAAVDLDASGNVIIAGKDNFPGEVIFLESYDADGEVRFSTTFDVIPTTTVHDVAVAPNGNIAITGVLSDGVSFGGNLLGVSGQPDSFAAVFTPEGEHVWSRRFGDDDWQRGDSIDFDSDSNVIIAAATNGTIDLGGMPHSTDADYQVVLAKLAAETGDRIWSRGFDASDRIGYVRIAADADAIYLGTADVEAGTMVDWGLGPEDPHSHLVKFDQSGATQWVRSFDIGLGVRALEPDSSRAVVVVGSMSGSVDFGDGPTEHTPSEELFIAKYGTDDGDLVWARVVADYDQLDRDQQATSVGVDGEDHIYVGGTFNGNINFGDQELVAHNGANGTDGVLARLEP